MKEKIESKIYDFLQDYLIPILQGTAILFTVYFVYLFVIEILQR